MLNDLDSLLDDIEHLLEALSDPKRTISSKSAEEVLPRYRKFKTFHKAIIELLTELEKALDDDNDNY